MRRFVLAFSLVCLTVILAACLEPKNRPEVRCADACEVQAKARCSDTECERGCLFVLDRLVEREQSTVLDCVSSGKGPCDDGAWADCAARVGPHVDGGPAAPPPAKPFDE